MRRSKVMALLAAVCMLTAVCFGGCGSAELGSEESVISSEAESSTEAESPEESKEESETESEAEESKTESEVLDRAAVFELFSKMNVGWNLGNTFDSHGKGNSIAAETYWGNPMTKKEMFDALAEQGFNTVRIPVTWAEHMGEAPDYTIDEDWLNRVETIVGYAMDNDMYVILDTHHETDYWLKPGQDGVEEQLAAVWKQIAERFKDYDHKLIFEGMNEPRNKGTAGEWNGGTAAERQVINELNAAFVETVRATGGKNADRCLIICTYGNNASYNALKDLVIPEDNNIAVAVHMYTPYVFTFQPNSTPEAWDSSKISEVKDTLKNIDKFLLQKDVPVIVTEFGAVNKDNTQDVVNWLADYMGAMNEYGVKCVWWDNGNYTGSGERFGLLNRRSLKWYSQEVADALISNSVTAE